MERLSKITVEQVKAFDDIVSVVRRYVQLTKRGRNYIGLCPFHSEKTPSFTVSPEKKLFHCFGCHESGDIISFIQKIDHLPFLEAVEVVAEMAGIPIQKEAVKFQRENKLLQSNFEKEMLIDCLNQAQQFYTQQIQFNEQALSYLKNRGLNQETITSFGLGACISSGPLIKFLKNQDISTKLMKEVGLINHANGNDYERFTGRVTFPIHDYQGRIVGFGGRVFQSNSKFAKYINSEETSLFNKRRLLYGIHKAKKFISTHDKVLVMEGYMDVIVSHQYGFHNSVACMGTALTDDQIKLIKRLTRNVYLVLDNDNAGLIATQKSYIELKKNQMSVKIIQLSKKDPADTLIDNGADFFHELINQAVDGFVFLCDHLCQTHDIGNIEQKAKVVNNCIDYLKHESDQIIQDYYIDIVVKKCDVKKELILAKMSNRMYNSTTFKSEYEVKKKSKYQKAEEIIIFVMVSSKNLRDKIIQKIDDKYFFNAKLREIYKLISKNKCLENSEWVEYITDNDLKQCIVRLMVSVGDLIPGHTLESQYKEYLDLIVANYNINKRKELREKVRKLELSGNGDQAVDILNELKGG